MIFNGHVKSDVDGRELMVQTSEILEQGGTDRQKRDVRSPDVAKSGFDKEDGFSTNQGAVGVSAPIERKNFLQGASEGFPNFCREDEEERNVRKERDNKNIDVEDT
jgi:hypothetical protein